MKQLVMAVVIGAYGCSSISRIEGPTPETVIAVVEKEMILYSEIQVDKVILRFSYAVQYGRFPETRVENEPWTSMKLKREKRHLLWKIRETIRQRWINEFSISATREETAARVQKLVAERGRPAIEQWIASSKALLQALEAVEQRLMNEQEAVDALLKRDLSSLEWDEGRRTWPRGSGVPLRLYLKEVTSGNFDQFLIPQARVEVVEEKLRDKIHALLAEKNEEFRKYDAALKQKDEKTLAAFRAKDPCYPETMRRKWWQQQYAAATIEIFESSFADAKELLLSPVHAFQEKSTH